MGLINIYNKELIKWYVYKIIENMDLLNLIKGELLNCDIHIYIYKYYKPDDMYYLHFKDK